ncbi:MAG: beta-lactamase family protein [Robiginitomaculum sp.]|nr:beta-lactamase family protein [Robiginitomaculum sp.]
MKKGDIAGIAIGVSTKGFRQSVYHGMADIELKKPITKDTQFRIASITKPITAACILKLIEIGELSFDTTIDTYFPKFPRAKEVTIYQLLTHTSGIPNWWGRLPHTAPDDFMSSGLAHQWLAKMNVVYLFDPGTQWDYSNSGYLLLGEIIERVTHTSYNDAVKRLVLSKVGAGATEIENPALRSPLWAKGYQSIGGSLLRAKSISLPFAAGGLRSTLHDLLAFSDAVFHGHFLSSLSLAAMTSHATTTDDRPVGDALYVASGGVPEIHPPEVTEMGYGLGINTWVQSGERFYSHAGLIEGFGSYLIFAPRTQTTAVILSNSFRGTASLHEQLRELLIAAPES